MCGVCVCVCMCVCVCVHVMCEENNIVTINYYL